MTIARDKFNPDTNSVNPLDMPMGDAQLQAEIYTPETTWDAIGAMFREMKAAEPAVPASDAELKAFLAESKGTKAKLAKLSKEQQLKAIASLLED